MELAFFSLDFYSATCMRGLVIVVCLFTEQSLVCSSRNNTANTKNFGHISSVHLIPYLPPEHTVIAYAIFPATRVL